jgi:hypothetical protein
MTFAADAQDVVDSAFATFGRAATYEAQTAASPETFAAPVTVTLIPTTRNRELGGFSSTSVLADEALFEVRLTEVAAPKRHDRITMDGIKYRIHSDPMRRDRFGLVWRIGLRTER